MSDGPIPDFTLTAGPLFLGIVFSGIFFGIFCVQIYFYYLNFPDDPRVLKLYVTTVFIVEVLDEALDIAYGWQLFGSGWGKPQDLLGVGGVEPAMIPLTGIIASLAHAFYCWRIYKLSRSWILTLFIVLLSLMQMVMSFVYQAFQIASGGTLDEALITAGRAGIAWIAGAVATDVVITITIVILLSRARKRTRFRDTSFKIQSAIIFTVETGFATTCCAILEIAMFFGLSAGTTNNNIHLIFFQMLSKLYSNSIAAALNARALTNRKIAQSSSGLISDGQFRSTFWSDVNNEQSGIATNTATSTLPPQKIKIRTHTVVDKDNLEMDTLTGDEDKLGTISKNQSFLPDAV